MKSFLLAVVIFLLSLSVAKADNSVYQYYVGTITGCNAAPLNAGAVTCEIGTRIWGFTLASLELIYTDHAAGEGTGFTAQLQGCNEGYGAGNCADATDWSLIATESIIGGIITLTPATLTVASDATIQEFWSIGVNYRRMRIIITGTGAPVAADTITVKVMLAIP